MKNGTLEPFVTPCILLYFHGFRGDLDPLLVFYFLSLPRPIDRLPTRTFSYLLSSLNGSALEPTGHVFRNQSSGV